MSLCERAITNQLQLDDQDGDFRRSSGFVRPKVSLKLLVPGPNHSVGEHNSRQTVARRGPQTIAKSTLPVVPHKAVAEVSKIGNL